MNKHNHTKHNETHVYYKICVAENILLIQILFEEVCFGASFEGRDRKTVVERESDRIQYLCSKESIISQYTRHIAVYVT